MMTGPAGPAPQRARIARRLGLDHNPLRRRSDKVQAIIMAALLATFVVGAPVSVIAASHVAGAAATRAEQAQNRWRRVPAVLLQASPQGAGFLYQPATIAWVQAVWTAPNGTVRTGEVPAATGTKAGSTVRVWVDAAGNVTTAPLSATQMLDRVVAAVAFTPIVLGILLLSLAAIVRWVFERRRLTSWELAWEAIEPQWSHRT